MQNQVIGLTTFYLVIAILLTFDTDANAQAWVELNDPPFYKHHSNGFGLNGKAYVFEGTLQEGRSNEVWEYTPQTDTWVRLPDFPGDGRAIAIGDDWNGKYYYGFGNSGGSIGYKNDLWVFDPVDTSYTQLPSCPCQGRSHPALIAHNDKIFMGSGSTGNGDLDDWWVYDMITQEWTQKQDMPGGPRHHPFFFSEGNSVFVGGGHVFNWLRFDLDTEEWSFINDFPDGRVAGSQFSYDGYGFLLGGDDAAHVHVPDWQSFMRYNPQEDEWETLPELPNGSRWANSSFIVDDILYFLGGISDNISGDNTMWKFDLAQLDCLPLQNMTFSGLTDSTANLFWNSNPNAASDTLKWRKVGTTAWTDIPNPQATLVLEGLETCEEYEVVFVNSCGSSTTYSDVFNFRTKGCCVNPQFEISTVDENSTRLEWTDLSFASTYELRWRPVGTTTWTTGSTFSANFSINDLPECQEYEVQIKSVCFVEPIDFSESVFFYSPGCGSCLDLDFCEISTSLQGSEDYINEVQINGFINTTGNDNGYGNFALPDTETLLQGETFELSVETVYATSAYDLSVWIDFNGDGSFTADENVVQEQAVANSFTADILIPLSSQEGLSRMRIIYGTANSGDLTPCGGATENLGEAEDYCIIISNITSTYSPTNENRLAIVASPNPFQNSIRVAGNFKTNGSYDLKLINVFGEILQYQQGYDFANALNLEDVPAGIYFLSIEEKNEKVQETIRLVKE